MKICKDCGKPRNHSNPLVSRCKECSYTKTQNKLVRTQIKPISNKRKERLSNGGGEKETMRAKLIESQDNGVLTCDVCNTRFSIENAGPYCLPHILNKKDYPHLRLFINNLGIVCSIKCHGEFDKIVNKIKKEVGNKEFETIIASGEDVSNLIDKYKSQN